jgi:stage II sporulation protein M
MKKQKFSLREEYKQSWEYIKESKKFIWIIVGIFVFFVLVGAFVPMPVEISNEIFNFMKNMLAQTEGMSQLQLTWFIFFNNLKSSFFGMIFGVFFGLFSIITSLANGFVVGFVMKLSVDKVGILSLWKILPHGIFELPAVFISLGMGLKIGSFIFKKKKLEFLDESLRSSLRVFLLIVIPLLVIAAIIEAGLIALAG